jgi:hypothetical protein
LFKANKYRNQLGTYHIMQLLREAAARQRKNKNTEVIGCLCAPVIWLHNIRQMRCWQELRADLGQLLKTQAVQHLAAIR